LETWRYRQEKSQSGSERPTNYLSKKEMATKSAWALEQKIESGGDNKIGGRRRLDVDVGGVLGGTVDEQEWLGVDGSGKWRFW